jgi:hypothetical protein
MALPGPLLDKDPWKGKGLRRCPSSTPIKEQLWLVLPEGGQNHDTVQEIAEKILRNQDMKT